MLLNYFRTSIFKGSKQVYLLHIFLVSCFLEISHKVYNLNISKVNRHNHKVGFPTSAPDNTYQLKISCICMVLNFFHCFHNYSLFYLCISVFIYTFIFPQQGLRVTLRTHTSWWDGTKYRIKEEKTSKSLGIRDKKVSFLFYREENQKETELANAFWSYVG